MGAPRGHVRALPPGLQRSTRGEDAAGPGWGPAWPGVRRNGGLRAAGGFGALKPGPARCLGRGPRGRLRLRDPQHVSQRTPLAYSLPAPRLGCGGRGVSGDPGILRGALGLGFVELAEGAGSLPLCPSAQQRAGSPPPHPGPSERLLGQGRAMCPLALLVLGLRSSSSWAGGWRGSDLDLHLLLFPNADFSVQ